VEQIPLVLALLACPIGMGLMMWFMSRGMRGDHMEDRTRDARSLAALRAEQARLEREIARRAATVDRDDELARDGR
jgi:hypothetical protein